jgi:autotransporter passenger strand-loop-strand repeat protein
MPMSSFTVSAGAVSSGIVLSAADTLNVLPGGTAVFSFLSHGGVATVSGTIIDTDNTRGGQELIDAGGTALFTTLSGGFERVLSGGIASGTTLDDLGFLLVSSGGTAIAPTLTNDSVAIVNSGGTATGAVVSSGGALAIVGGIASGTVVSAFGAAQVIGGTESGAVISSGGNEYVSSGGTAVATEVSSGGAEIVLSGGFVANTTILRGGVVDLLRGAAASGIIVESGGTLMLTSGSDASYTSETGATIIVSGGVTADAVSASVLTVTSGGSADSVLSLGTATSFTVSSGVISSTSGGAVVSGGSASPSWNLFNSSSESYFVPYASASFGHSSAADPQISLTLTTLGGQQVFTGVGSLDTGSRGITISQASVPTITQGADDPSGSIFYWSSGILRLGYWHDFQVTFNNASGTNTDGAAATATVRVLIVQEEVHLAGNWPNDTTAETTVSVPGATGIGLIGIGFDRTGDGDTPENNAFNQNYNPLLNLTQMQTGAMTAGFIITTSGLELGLTAADTSAGANGGSGTFSYEKLLPTPFTAVSSGGSGSPDDWQAPTGSVVYNGGSASPVGQVVLDTGINNALLTLSGNAAQPADPSENTTVANGTTITTNLLGTSGGVSYTYVAGDTSNAMAPTNTTWSAIQSGNQAFSENQNQTVLDNTGVDAFNGFNYLYDPTDGYLGLQLNGNSSAATAAQATDDPVIVYQGTTTLKDGFETSYPIQLADAFDTLASVGLLAAGTATFAGDITGGTDTITGTAVPITLDILGGDIHLTGSNAYADALIAPGATLDLGNDAAGGGQRITFGGGGTLVIDAGIVPDETLWDLGHGGAIDVLGITSASATATGDSLVITGTGGSLTLSLDAPVTAQITTSADPSRTGTLVTIACFAAGTRIATPSGPVPIESLRIGDRVLTEGGAAMPIRWLGQRHVDCRRHPMPAAILPVRIDAHAFGLGRPAHPLLLSPDHAIFAEGVLIPVKYLIDGALIRQVTVEEISYFHLELPQHAVVFAEGLPVESYLDTGDRLSFDGAVTALHPLWGQEARDVTLMFDALGYAPLRVAGPEVERLRAMVQAAAPRLMAHQR